MSLEKIIDGLRQGLDSLLHVPWLSTAITVIVVAVITLILAQLAAKLLRRLFHMDVNPLPTLSIFINIARGTVLVIGLCVILSTCFGINVSAAVTALGIGGIAVSLGFQSTLSNLIGGLQISLGKLIMPGEHIKVGSNEGIVNDITWRNTSIIAANGDTILIPNSVINSEALIKMKRDADVRIDIFIPHSATQRESLDQVATAIEQAADKALGAITLLDKDAQVYFTEVTRDGYHGVLYFTVVEGVKLSDIRDTALRAISQYASQDAPKPQRPASEGLFGQSIIGKRHRKKMRLSRRQQRKLAREQRNGKGSAKPKAASTASTASETSATKQ